MYIVYMRHIVHAHVHSMLCHTVQLFEKGFFHVPQPLMYGKEFIATPIIYRLIVRIMYCWYGLPLAWEMKVPSDTKPAISVVRQ